MKPPHTQSEPPLLAVKEVARRLSISVKTVRRLVASGELPVHRIGRLVRIADTDLQRFVGQHRG